MDLVEFLAARLDEDEQAARDAHYEGQRWISEEEGVWRWPDDEAVHTADRKRDAAHIARHDPARVLADIKAKRLLLIEHADFVVWSEGETSSGERVQDPGWVCRTCVDRSAPEPWELADAQTQPCPTLRILALPYAEHPDYQPEWKP